MGQKTNIEWCDSTINGTSGCDGCELWNNQTRTCYAGNLQTHRLSIRALIELSDDGALVPHGLGGHARNMLAAAYHRLGKKRKSRGQNRQG